MVFSLLEYILVKLQRIDWIKFELNSYEIFIIQMLNCCFNFLHLFIDRNILKLTDVLFIKFVYPNSVQTLCARLCIFTYQITF